MKKEELRTTYLKKRQAITDKKTKSDFILEKIISLPEYQNAQKIALYYNLPSEVETISLINHSLKEKKQIFLPTVIDNINMEFYQVTNINEITNKSTFGIYEPTPNKDQVLDKKSLDLIIIPGVVFDKSKNRIGFGKGYYDKYLSGASNIFKIAICFEDQIIKDELIPTTSNDIKMDILVTEENIYK